MDKLANSLSEGPVYDWFAPLVTSLREWSVVSEWSPRRSDCWSKCLPDTTMQLAAGGNKLLRLFDVATPGRQCQVIKTHSKKHPGQPGAPRCWSHRVQAV